MAINLNLSYAHEMLSSFRFEGDDDPHERNFRLSLFRRPIDEDQNKGQGTKLPNISICMHWGVWVEFEDSKKRFGRCIYSFDADVQRINNKKDDTAGSTDLTDLTNKANLVFGNFIVKGFEFFPDQLNQKHFIHETEHPYENKIVHDEDYVVGRLSPARLLQIVRQVARQYETKTYNFVLQNCQNFAIDLRCKIFQSMTKISNESSQLDNTPWTSGHATTAAVGVGITAVAAILGLTKIFGNSSSQQEEEKRGKLVRRK